MTIIQGLILQTNEAGFCKFLFDMCSLLNLKEADAAQPIRHDPAPKEIETLLFVEDDVVTRRVYSSYLRQRGYIVLEAQHGREAFDVYEDNKDLVQLIVTDMVMPGLNGRQWVDLISLHRPHLKVLYISGFTRASIIQRGILGAETPFLEKPFGREELALRVRQLLDAPPSPA